MTNTLKNILDSLNEMNPDEIAEFFEDRAVRGVPEQSSKCPVARWVKSELNDPVSSVRATDVHAYPSLGVCVFYSDGSRENNWDVPVNVATFMRLFDNRQYRNLIEPKGDVISWSSPESP